MNISNTTLSTWLWEENVVPPKTRRKTKKKLKKKLKYKLNDTSSKKVQNNIKETIESIDSADAHSRRPKSKLYSLFRRRR